MESKWAGIEDDEELDELEYNFTTLPPYACYYCGNHDPKTVVFCTEENCNRWFCNSFGVNKGGSHIIAHLVKARHKSVLMHHDSILGELAIECYLCSCRNVFNLGLVPSKFDSTLIFLCREPCLMRNVVKEKEFDTKKWQPLIEERKFLAWIVKSPSPDEDSRAKKITLKAITSIEDNIKAGATVSPSEIVPEKVKKIRLRYRTTRDYRNIYSKLIELEEEYEREIKKAQKETNVTIQWEHHEKKSIAKFNFYSEDTDIRLVLGDELKVKSESGPWKGIGTILEINEADELRLVITTSSGPIPSQAAAYTIKFL